MLYHVGKLAGRIKIVKYEIFRLVRDVSVFGVMDLHVTLLPYLSLNPDLYVWSIIIALLGSLLL